MFGFTLVCFGFDFFFFFEVFVFSVDIQEKINSSAHAESSSIGAAPGLLSFKVRIRLEYFIRIFMGC